LASFSSISFCSLVIFGFSIRALEALLALLGLEVDPALLNLEVEPALLTLLVLLAVSALSLSYFLFSCFYLSSSMVFFC
jgi:hypothetical protein